MNAWSARNARGIFASVLTCLSVLTNLLADAGKPRTATPMIVKAANTFFATLNAQQRKSVLFAFGDERRHARWSNLPTPIARRPGLSMGELNAAQRSAALALVQSTLSRRGFEKVQEIVEGNEVLKTSEGNNPMFGKDLLYISLLGTASEKDPWML